MATGCGYEDPKMELVTCRKPAVTDFLEWETSEGTPRRSQHHLHNNQTSCGNVLKPFLPPKPHHGPPLYREPPNPTVPSSSHTLHLHVRPDACNLSSSTPNVQDKQEGLAELMCTTSNKPFSSPSQVDCNDSVSEDSKPAFSGTQAWVHEHKTHSNVVGERLSTLQRKLKSLLTQTQRKTGELLYGDNCKPCSNETGSFHAFESTHNDQNKEEIRNDQMTNSQHDEFVYGASASTNNINQTISVHSGTSFQPIERHPFESEAEETHDTSYIRDTCTKLFSRDSKVSSCISHLNQRSNCYTNNIKSAFDYDKLVPKEVIGRSSHERKQTPSAFVCNTANPNINLRTSDQQINTSKPLDDISHDSRFYSIKPVSHGQESCFDSPENASSSLHKSINCSDNATVPIDCGDNSDQYKSSSESGHGTMQSCSIRDSKSIVSAYSSSRISHLDTSIDSDCANCCPWENLPNSEWEEKLTVNRNINKCETTETPDVLQEISNYTDNAHISVRPNTEETKRNTPPLLPLSLPPSSSLKSLQQASPKDDFDFPLSSSNLNSLQNNVLESELNDSEESRPNESSSCLTKSNMSRKTGVKKTSNSTPVISHQWNGKSKGARSSSTTKNSYACRKSHCSTFSKQPLVVPSYDDYADPEWTSTTTGLDGESFIDDQDDLSSNLSASTLDPFEISMVRRQLEGLEQMYSEILHHLSGKNNGGKVLPRSLGNISDFKNSRCQTSGSVSSLAARSSNSRLNHMYFDKRGFFEKRRGKDLKHGSAHKRLQRLESHVVTLARSVAHLSSEMRTQHILVQELEQMRRDITWVNERLHLMQLAHCSPGTYSHISGDKKLHMPKDCSIFHNEVNELLNPNRAKKLTKFFGDEPPLIRQFLKSLGYEKYAINFETEKIGIMELPYLNEERLQKIGVPMGPRIRIIQEAHAYCQQNQYKVYIV